MLLNVVDTLMLARFDAAAVGATGVAAVMTLLVLFSTSGLLFGIDPIVSQAHGRGDGDAAARALQRGVVIALAASIPIALVFCWAEPILSLIRPDLAPLATRYVWAQIPGVPFVLCFVALRQYLQSRGIVRPAMYVVLAANLLNGLLNWALIFGHFGFPALGVVGSGIATAIVQVCSFLALLLWTRSARLHANAWTPWSREVFEWSGFRQILRIGVPIWLQIELELGTIVATTLIASRFSIGALAGHEISMKIAGLAFQVPLGLSLALSARVGHHLGSGNLAAAHSAVRSGLILSLIVIAVPVLLLTLVPSGVARLLSSDTAVIATCAAILPIVGVMHAFDGIQVVATGALRGQGRTLPATWSNLIGHWGIGLPLAAWLALNQDWGVPGIWWGLTVGMLIVALLLGGLALTSKPRPLEN